MRSVVKPNEKASTAQEERESCVTAGGKTPVGRSAVKSKDKRSTSHVTDKAVDKHTKSPGDVNISSSTTSGSLSDDWEYQEFQTQEEQVVDETNCTSTRPN